LGASGALFDWPIQDPTGQREQIAHWIANQLELPFLYRRWVRLVVNGVDAAQRTNALGFETARVYEDAQEPDADFLEQWYPGNSEGDLFKLQVWRQSDHFPLPTGYDQQQASLANYTNKAGAKHLARYRWNWRKRATEERVHNYTNLYSLVFLSQGLQAWASKPGSRTDAPTFRESWPSGQRRSRFPTTTGTISRPTCRA
jgi:hypothetical protein